MRVLRFNEGNTMSEKTVRPETGPMQFGGDWPGVFIRGDNAAHFAGHLRIVLDDLRAHHSGNISAHVVDGLISDLESAIEQPGTRPAGLQQLRSWSDCVRGSGDASAPIPMVLHCPDCRARHVDAGEFATKPHHTHSCQVCGLTWRPAVVATVGVQFLPGFKDSADDK